MTPVLAPHQETVALCNPRHHRMNRSTTPLHIETPSGLLVGILEICGVPHRPRGPASIATLPLRGSTWRTAVRELPPATVSCRARPTVGLWTGRDSNLSAQVAIQYGILGTL
jgi:hypothetical protein